MALTLPALPALPVRLLAASGQVQAPAAPHEQRVGELVVEFEHARETASPRTMEFWGNVVARYGPTTVRCDRLVLHPEETERWGEATGNVRLDDPDGQVTASSLRFSWLAHTGTAMDARVSVQGLDVRASRIEISPSEWVLYDVAVDTGGAKPPYGVRTSKLVVRPGQTATLTHPRLDLFGQTVASAPSERVSLTGSNLGFNVPSVTWRNGHRLGIEWNNSFAFSDRTQVLGNVGWFQSQVPSYSLRVDRDLSPDSGGYALRQDLEEKFGTGWLDNVGVVTPEQEFSDLRRPRSAVELGTFWNVTGSSRTVEEHFDKPAELGYHLGGPVGGWAGSVDVRGQRVGLLDEPYHDRVKTELTLEPPILRLGKRFGTLAQASAGGFFAGSDRFEWVRAEVGGFYEPTKWMRVGASYVLGRETGDPLFAFDRLPATRAVNLRVDLGLGSTTLGFMAKYDSVSRTWYDHEIYVGQTIPGLEIYAVEREFPREFRFGLRLRLDRLREALSHRTVRRPAESGGSN